MGKDRVLHSVPIVAPRRVDGARAADHVRGGTRGGRAGTRHGRRLRRTIGWGGDLVTSATAEIPGIEGIEAVGKGPHRP
jgi:hypothetical protein